MSKPQPAEIAEAYCRKFPETGNLTLARMLLRDEPLLFKNLEAARSCVRYVRGANGAMLRNKRKGKTALFRKRSSGDAFSKIPDGISHFEDITPLKLKPGRIGILSDIHVPYHEKSPLVAALKEMRKIQPETIVLNGDVADCFSISFWEKDPRKRDFAHEIKTVREFLQTLRRMFKKARIVYKLGNHEERYERYLSVKAPELLGVDDFQFEKLTRFADHGIELCSSKRTIKAGKLNIIHGHEFRWGITSPVNPARGFYMRAKDQVLAGHLHQTSGHSEKTVRDVVISSWSTGCLCDLKPDYAPYNNWNHGFALVELDRDGGFEVSNKKIIHGRIYSA